MESISAAGRTLKEESENRSLLAKEEITQGKVGRPKMLDKPVAKLLEAVKTKSD